MQETVFVGDIDPTVSLPLMEAFPTIQGEGYHQGKAAWFIRLAGCDVGCVWCDVKESWDAEVHPVVPLEEIVRGAENAVSPVVVITGGEPLMYDLSTLTAKLKASGKQTHIETSGAYPLSGTWDWICLSPKKFKAPLEIIYPYADELKIIVYNKSDFAWGERFRQLVNPACKLYLQPEWGKEKQMLPLIMQYIQDHPEWQLSLQIHKYLGIP